MNALARCGFTYDLRVRRASSGKLLAVSKAKNRVPAEGLNLIASAVFAAGPVPPALYIGLYSGSHVPDGTETAANLATLVTEITAYEGATRKAFVPGAISNGGCSNAASLATFNFTGDATVNGAFISTVAAKGATTGSLLSVVRFPIARPVDASVYVEVLSGFQLLSM